MQKTNEHILETAANLFYKQGYHATGIGQIAQESGVGKPTIYHYFKSKDHLIEEVTKYRMEKSLVNLKQKLAEKEKHPRKKLIAVFDIMHENFQRKDFYGCPFLNASAEFSDPSSVVRKLCAKHYQNLTDYYTELAIESKLDNPREFAENFITLVAGTYSSWYVAGDKDAALKSKLLASALL